MLPDIFGTRQFLQNWIRKCRSGDITEELSIIERDIKTIHDMILSSLSSPVQETEDSIHVLYQQIFQKIRDGVTDNEAYLANLDNEIANQLLVNFSNTLSNVIDLETQYPIPRPRNVSSGQVRSTQAILNGSQDDNHLGTLADNADSLSQESNIVTTEQQQQSTFNSYEDNRNEIDDSGIASGSVTEMDSNRATVFNSTVETNTTETAADNREYVVGSGIATPIVLPAAVGDSVINLTVNCSSDSDTTVINQEKDTENGLRPTASQAREQEELTACEIPAETRYLLTECAKAKVLEGIREVYGDVPYSLTLKTLADLAKQLGFLNTNRVEEKRINDEYSRIT